MEEQDQLLEEIKFECHGVENLGALQSIDIAFTKIPSLDNLQGLNLRELSLIDTGPVQNLKGLTAIAHSLESLRLEQIELTQISEEFNALVCLRDLYLPCNKIQQIENLDNCVKLTKLVLFSNQISRIENLENNQFLEELWLQNNNISKLENLSQLPNLQALYVSGNPIAKFSDFKEIAYLGRLTRLKLADSDFPACPCAEIPGYQNYILSTVTSPQFLILDDTYVDPNSLESARGNYDNEVMVMEQALMQLEKDHRQQLTKLENRLNENDEQLNAIVNAVIKELHNLRTDIDSAKASVLKRQQKMKEQRDQSEQVLKEELQQLQIEYNQELNKIYKQQQASVQTEQELHASILQYLEFEREVSLLLIDLLYSTHGKVIYQNIYKQSAEWRMLERLLQERDVGEQTTAWVLQKCYQLGASEMYAQFEYNSSHTRYFLHLKDLEQARLILARDLNETLTLTYDLSSIVKTPANYLICVVRNIEGGTSQTIQLTPEKLQSYNFEYVLLVQAMTHRSHAHLNNTIDERMLALIADPLDFPPSSVDTLRKIEHSAIEKYNEHQRKIWGELDANATNKLKAQDEELNTLVDIVESLGSQIEMEHRTQEQLLGELRVTLKEGALSSNQSVLSLIQAFSKQQA